jgi:hypothetical protein
VCAPACGPEAASEPEPAPAARQDQTIGWRPLGSWSGRGSTQTESFLVQWSVVRVRWETKTEPSADKGTFRLSMHSAVSGRQLAVIADHRGSGKGEAYVPDEPRPAYLIVESEHLDWSVTAEEGEAGTVGAPAVPAASSLHARYDARLIP